MESSDDRSNCVFSGRFQLKIPTEHDRLLSFDISALRGTLLAVEGIRVLFLTLKMSFSVLLNDL